jgi:integrase
MERRPEGTNLAATSTGTRRKAASVTSPSPSYAVSGRCWTGQSGKWESDLRALVAIRLLIFTGCRSAEILGLRWQDVDIERRCLHLSDSKTGKRAVLINGAAVAILEGLERARTEVFVIPGDKPGTHRRSLQAVWERIRQEAEIPDVRIHDLRHTFASFGVNGGQNLNIVGRLLGHSKVTTTQRYAHLADDPIRRATERMGEALAGSMANQP